ncbi:MAG TPA: glycosyltransferase [Gemmatimonadaceae bacterium]
MVSGVDGARRTGTPSTGAPSATPPIRGAFRIRWRARWRGVLARTRLLADVHAVLLLMRSVATRSRARSLESLLTACRRATWRPVRSVLRRRIAPLLQSPASSVWQEHGVGIERYYGSFADIRDLTLTSSVVLKAPGSNGEKGVLYSSFEYNWLRIAKSPGALEFFRDYYLVGASSWSPPDYASFAHLAGLSEDPAFIGISNLADVAAYRMMAPVIEPVPIMACDWVNPDYYQPKARADRRIDILMVANWLPFKRHWLLFEALRHLPRNLSVVLVGRDGEGRTEKEIRAEARAFGVRQDLELHTNIDIERVTSLQCDARISLLFSAREGSCVAPVEGFFADTPVGMMEDCHVGSKAYINNQTGTLFGRTGLGRQLREFLDSADRYTPRRWALDNVTCHLTSRRLNDQLAGYARARHQPWTVDIAPLCWRYLPEHVRGDDARRFQSIVATFPDRYGFAIRPIAAGS